MAHTDGSGTSDVLLEYAGPLFFIGAQVGQQPITPLLSMTGGMTGGKIVRTDTFPMGNFMALDSASQTYTVTENGSLTAPASDIFVPSQQTNYVELHHRRVTLSYKRQSMTDAISGEAVLNMGTAGASSMQAQRNAHLMQLALDLNYSMHLGTGTDPSTADTNGKTRGIVTAVDADGSTEINADSAAFSKDLMKQLEVAILAANGGMQTPVIFCGAYIKQKINEEYGYAPESVTVGGVTLDAINLPNLGRCGLVYDPTLTASVLGLYDVSKIAPVFMPVPGKPAVFFEALAKTGAGDDEQLYCQFGVDYGHADWHGIIKGLATS